MRELFGAFLAWLSDEARKPRETKMVGGSDELADKVREHTRLRLRETYGGRKRE